VGVGKTEIAKVLASVYGRTLIRLQCYEGIDTNQALYEWDYARQLLYIRALSERDATDEDAIDKLFGPKFLLERPLLQAIEAGDRAVLLIDEVDRADDEFEAFLLEVLSDFQIDLYWAGRTCLITRRDDISVYDEVFYSFFLPRTTLSESCSGSRRRPLQRPRRRSRSPPRSLLGRSAKRRRSWG
jgi:hypothetical protein